MSDETRQELQMRQALDADVQRDYKKLYPRWMEGLGKHYQVILQTWDADLNAYGAPVEVRQEFIDALRQVWLDNMSPHYQSEGLTEPDFLNLDHLNKEQKKNV